MRLAPFLFPQQGSSLFANLDVPSLAGESQGRLRDPRAPGLQAQKNGAREKKTNVRQVVLDLNLDVG